MPIALDRRSLLGGGALLAAAVSSVARAAAAGFTHGVASGDPGATGVILWTRYVPQGGGDARLSVEVADDIGFARIVSRGEVVASPADDHCAKAAPADLAPGRWYYYRFTAPGGERSTVGRTRTLPTGRTDAFRIAAFSCANLEFGFFNAYAHAAARDDIDLLVHLGDYIYEWGVGRHSAAARALRGNEVRPATETVALADYRARYASYRTDRDLQRLHQLYPMISIIDDHEVANNSWAGGAGNHQPEEGTWDARKAAAMKAYHEWLPMRDAPYASYTVGDLATLFRAETRLLARDRPLSLDAVFASPDPRAALAAFRDGPLADPRRALMGAAQEKWLSDGLAASTRAGVRWQLLAQQVVMGPIALPQTVDRWFAGGAPRNPKDALRLEAAKAAARAGLPLGFDNWGGYPAARERLLGAASAARADLVTLTGDSHNAWAFDLSHGGRPAGVEIAGQSVASVGFEARFDGDPARIAADMIAANPALKWCDTSRRGYVTLGLTRAAATAEWVLLDTVARPSTTVAATRVATIAYGDRRLTL